MTPGRPPERDELDALLDLLLQHAQDLLRRHGEFYPFGNVMTNDGEISAIGAYTGTEHPPSQDLIDLLVEEMRAQAVNGRIRAAAICYDVRVKHPGGKPTDAIAVSLEHRAGDTVLVLLHYTKGRFTGVKFGDLTASQGQRRVFVAD